MKRFSSYNPEHIMRHVFHTSRGGRAKKNISHLHIILILRVISL